MALPQLRIAVQVHRSVLSSATAGEAQPICGQGAEAAAAFVGCAVPTAAVIAVILTPV